MTEEEWFAATDVRQLIGCAAKTASARKLRLFMVAWCRHNWERVTVPLVRDAVQLAEEFADGNAFKKQLETMFEATRSIPNGAPTSYFLWPDSSQMAASVDGFCLNDYGHSPSRTDDQGATYRAHQLVKTAIFRDIVGNPFRKVRCEKLWRTETAVLLARQMYESREFSAMPILADALQDAGCASDDILNHCRDPEQVHVRGCWVVDLVLGKS